MRSKSSRALSAVILVWVAALGGALLGLVSPNAAVAHAVCDQARPAPGASVSAAPGQVACDFTEPPAESSDMVVFDECGDEVSTGDRRILVNTMSVSVDIHHPGRYEVRWNTVSRVDGHPATGSWQFTVTGRGETCQEHAENPAPTTTSTTEPPRKGGGAEPNPPSTQPATEPAPPESGDETPADGDDVPAPDDIETPAGDDGDENGDSQPAAHDHSSHDHSDDPSALDGGIFVEDLLAGDGESATGPTAFVSIDAPPPLTVALTALFLIGAAAVAGTGSLAVAGLADLSGAGRRRFMTLAPLVGLGAALWLALRARSALGGSLSSFMSTPVGEAAALRLAGLLLAAIAGFVAVHRQSRAAAGWAAAGAGLAVIGHAVSSHAAATSMPSIQQLVHVIHVGGVAVWFGGLAAVIAGIQRDAPAERSTIVGRYASLAAWAFLVVAVTGIFRALAEVPTLDGLVESTYGRLVILKSQLTIGIAALAVRNRWWNIPLVARDTAPLRRFGAAEVLMAAVVVVVASILAQTSPPTHAAHTDHGGQVAGADHGDHDHAVPDGPCVPADDNEITLVAKSVKFDIACIEASSASPLVIVMDNRDGEIEHNVAIFGGEQHPGPDDPATFRGELKTEGVTRYEVGRLEAGTYHFHCDLHPTMSGVIEAS